MAIRNAKIVAFSFLLLLCPCVVNSMATESELESLRQEVAEQREKLAEHIQVLQKLEQRLDEAIQRQVAEDTTALSPKRNEKIEDTGRTDVSEATAEVFIQPEHEPIVGVSPRENLYFSLSDNEFAKSVPLFGSDFRFSFGGYTKLDMLHDFDGTGDEYSFVTAAIPVDGAPDPQQGSYSKMHVRETRFNFEMRNVKEGLPFNKAVLEMDFFDAKGAPRLRHAYAQWGNLLVGQTWTTLTMLQQLPLLLDFAAGDALYGGRDSQIRWEQEIDDNWSWAAAIESWSDEAIANPYDLAGTARAEWPQLVLRSNYDWDRGTFSVGGSLAQLRWDGTDGIEDESALSWAIVSGGRLYLSDSKDSFLGLGGSYGNGASANQINLIEGGATNAVMLQNGTLELLNNWNAVLSLHHEFSEKWATNWILAYGGTDPDAALFPNALKESGSAHANLIWHLAPEFLIGVEYMIGERENANGANGTAQRIQFSSMYSF